MLPSNTQLSSSMAWCVELPIDAVFDDWQPLARYLLQMQIPPDCVHWQSGATGDLFGSSGILLTKDTLPELKKQPEFKPPSSIKPRVPKDFFPLARFSACNKNPSRFALLYRLLWRLQHERKDLLFDSTDPDVHQANKWAKEVGRERHKMKAFIRFRAVELKDIDAGNQALKDAEPIYLAWFEPEHYTLKLASDFFVDRFYGMEWSILTPYLCMHWSEKKLSYTEGCGREQAPEADKLDNYWRVYYANIFNPARLKVKAMCAEMPKKYWHNLPEATLIKPLIQQAENLKQEMLDKAPTEPVMPAKTRFDRDKWLESKNT